MAFDGGDAEAESDAALAVRAAWFHYAGGMTQGDVARRLGITPARAHRLIARAVRDGQVRIIVEGPVGGCIALEAALIAAHGLASCRVVPELDEPDLPLTALGQAAASLLDGVLTRGEHAVIGIGHGRTLAAAVDHLPRRAVSSVRFVSLLGGLPHLLSANPFDVIHRLADRTKAAAQLLPVPFLANTAEDRAVLMRQRGITETFAAAGAATFCLVGIGEVADDAFLPASNMVSRAEGEALRRAGAVGEMLGHYFGADGVLIDTELHGRVIAVPPESLRGRELVAVAGGRGKVEAVGAILRSRLLTGLITDEATARRLVATTIERAEQGGTRG